MQRFSTSFLAALVSLFFLVGCSRSAFEEARQHAAQGHEEQAVLLYRQAILEGDQPLEAHLELARMSAKNDVLMSWWHYEQALRLLPEEDTRKASLLTARQEVMKATRDLLQQEDVRGEDDLRLKINLLEEHARKLNKWLEELRSENRQLRLKLGED